MTVFDWSPQILDDFSQTHFFKQGTGISTGSFDGLHLGHRFLLNKLVEECKTQNLASGVITFKRPLPALKHADDYAGDISTLEERLKLLEGIGIDFVIVVDFDQEFASMKGVTFLDLLVQKLNMKLLAEGIDFRCGYKGATDTQAIKYWAAQAGIQTIFVDPVYYTQADGSEERVSSSYIRHLIQKGYMTTVRELLGR
ncbi:MAG: FAD synthetase family protein [Treponema sp.]|nr:FAD synthetase family protein [Treponema sp.]